MGKRAVQVVIYIASLAAILFVGAGRVDWPMAWVLLGLYVAIIAVTGLFVDRGLAEERARTKLEGESWDLVLGGLSFWAFPVGLLIAALDVGRFGWSPALPMVVQISALTVFAAGNALASWAMVSNRFFSMVVRIQAERGHDVVTGGPYRIVRHPGYTGWMLASLFLPLALASLWAYLPVLVGVVALIARTALEDRTLRQELAGYADYARQVPYRLLPGVW